MRPTQIHFIDKFSLSRTFVACSIFWTVLAALSAATAVILASIQIYSEDASNFRALTSFEVGFVDGEPLIFKSTYNVPCTNKTYGTQDRTFIGDTHFGFRCSETTNPCAEMICGSDGQCRERTKPGGECHQNGECFNGRDEFCNWSTCQCEPYMVDLNCTSNTDCVTTNWTTCLENICVDGTCIQNYTMGSECASDENCLLGESCQNCLCVANDQCLVDADCPVLLDTCSQFTCIGGQCVEGLSPGATCSKNEQCAVVNGTDYDCNITTCECYELPMGECLNDVDCQSIDWTTCLEAVCNAGECQEQFSSGSECSNTNDCASGLICRDCACVSEYGVLVDFTPVITPFSPSEFIGMTVTSASYRVFGTYVQVWIIGSGIPDGLSTGNGYAYTVDVPYGTLNRLIGGSGTFTNVNYYGTFRLEDASPADAVNFIGYLTYAPGTTGSTVRNNLYFVYEID